MIKIILYIATSKDAYIADENGGVDWLPQTLEETGGQVFGFTIHWTNLQSEERRTGRF